MSTIATVIGLAAAVCTTTANLPQLKKAWTTGQTDDLSLKTLLLFGSGLALWVVYGIFQKDVVIILANGVSFLILSVISACGTKRTCQPTRFRSASDPKRTPQQMITNDNVATPVSGSDCDVCVRIPRVPSMCSDLVHACAPRRKRTT